jgi:hypothetical protein
MQNMEMSKMEKKFTDEELADAVVQGNKLMLNKLEEMCTEVARAQFQRDQLIGLAEEVRRSGDKRLANMAIATLAEVSKASIA